MQKAVIDIAALEQVHCAVRAGEINVVQGDVAADGLTRADHVTSIRLVLCAGDTLQVLDLDVADGQGGGVLVAESKVALAVALGDFNSVVDVGDGHGVVGDVVDTTASSATLKVARELGCAAGPDLYSGHVGGVEHGDVVDEDVLDNVDLADVLAEGADTDAVRAVAVQVLDEDFGAVGLEAHAVVAVVDDTVLDDNVAAPVGVPSVGVLGGVVALAVPANVDVAVHDVGTVGDEVVPLGGVAEVEVLDGTALEANDCKQDWAEDVDV